MGLIVTENQADHSISVSRLGGSPLSVHFGVPMKHLSGSSLFTADLLVAWSRVPCRPPGLQG